MLQVHYTPQIGFCLVLTEDAQPPPEWRFQFQRSADSVRVMRSHAQGTDASAADDAAAHSGTNEQLERHYKNDRMDRLDDHFGDIASEITDLQHALKRKLEETLLDYELHIHTAIGALARLDALLAFANSAEHYGYVRPEVEDSSRLIVQSGRHPLQEFTVEQFVPNDVMLVPNEKSETAAGVAGGGGTTAPW